MEEVVDQSHIIMTRFKREANPRGKGKTTWYLGIEDGRWQWSKDKLKALRLYSAEDAQAVIDLDHIPTGGKICEITTIPRALAVGEK